MTTANTTQVPGRPLRRSHGETWRSPHRLRAIRTVTGQFLLYLTLVIGSIVILFPFYWMVSTSVKPPDEVVTLPITWIPSRILWSNYPKAINALPVSVLVFVKNSVVLSTLVAIGHTFTSALVAYPFARLRFRGRRTLFLIILATMMIPGQITMIPLFIIFSLENPLRNGPVTRLGQLTGSVRPGSRAFGDGGQLDVSPPRGPAHRSSCYPGLDRPSPG